MNEALQKPSMWQRLKTGTTQFFGHALGYFPRGIALTGAVFAGSAILESMTGGFGLGVADWSNEMLLKRGLAHLALGSVISGVIGASTTKVDCACETSSAGLVPGTGTGKSAAAMGQHMVQSVTEGCVAAAGEQVFAGSGLPMAAKAAQHLMGGH